MHPHVFVLTYVGVCVHTDMLFGISFWEFVKCLIRTAVFCLFYSMIWNSNSGTEFIRNECLGSV